MFLDNCYPKYSFDDLIENEALLEFLKKKSKKQTMNFLRLISPNSKKKDRGRQKEKYLRFVAEKQRERQKIRDVIKEFAAAKSDTPAGQAVAKLIAFGNLLGIGF